VLIDMGHHHHSTNVEQIVGTLLQFGIPGSFHFNTRDAADDDHSVQADYEMARICYELLAGDVVLNGEPEKNWAFALDQMARTEQRIPSVLKSIDALKRSIAKAALCDRKQLASLQETKDLMKSNSEFERTLLHADATPVVMEAYVRQGLHPVPLEAYYESGYQETIEKERS
jgi:L-rhamnose isomerase